MIEKVLLSVCLAALASIEKDFSEKSQTNGAKQIQREFLARARAHTTLPWNRARSTKRLTRLRPSPMDGKSNNNFAGVVCSTKMERTLTFRRDYLHCIKKHRRFEKRHTMISAHVSPCFVGHKEGDIVTVGQCR